MVELVITPYDDGSSTESEYYFDINEEEEVEDGMKPYVREYEAPVKQKPFNELQPRHKEENVECKNSDRSERIKCKEMLLPQGSEWSHGITSIVSDNAVERALAMVRELRKATQRDEALTTDTTNSNASPIERKLTIEKKVEKMAILKEKRKGEEAKSDVVSLKRVKATLSPAIVAKPVIVELKRALTNVVEETTEMEKGLVVTPSQLKMTESQARLKAKEIEDGTLLPQKQSGPQERKPEMVTSSRRTETKCSDSAAIRGKAHSRIPLVRRPKGSNLPTSRPVEQESRTKRDTSPVSHHSRSGSVIRYSRRSRSRSPPSRRVEERRTRSRSRPRSSCKPSTVSSSLHSRSHRISESVSSRRHHSSEKQPSHDYKRPQSRSRSRWSVQTTRGYRQEHDRHESRNSHYDSHDLKSSPQLSDESNGNRRSPSHCEFTRTSRGAQETNRETFYCRSIKYHRSRSVRDREKLVVSPREDYKFGNRTMEETEVPLAAPTTRDFLKQRTTFRALPATTASNTTERGPIVPHIRSRVNASAASSIDVEKSSYDQFEQQVFKLKLRKADIDQMMVAGPCGEFSWLCDSRKKAFTNDRARLMAQDLERFEKVYASLNVTPFQLKRYQSDRDFSWRVVQLRRRQVSLMEQNDVLMSSERKADLRRRLDEERKSLIAENAVLFHKVMMSQDRHNGRKPFAGSVDITQSSGQRALGADVYQRHKGPASVVSESSLFTSPANISRVVVGAALQLRGDNARLAHN